MVFDDIYGSVENSIDSVINGIRNKVVGNFVFFVSSDWQYLVDLEDVVKVISVLQDVFLYGIFKILVEGQDIFVVDSFDNVVDYVVVVVGRSFVLQMNFDEFERYDDDSFSGIGGSICEDGEWLVYFGYVEYVVVDFVLFIVGSEFGGMFGSFYEDGSVDIMVQVREVVVVVVLV